MSCQSLGRLWVRYFRVGNELDKGKGEARGEVGCQVGYLRERLAGNYSPPIKHVAGPVGARMTRVLEQEDIISWGVLSLLEAIAI